MTDHVASPEEATGIPESLRRRAVRTSFAGGAYIFREGEPVKDLYIVRSGTANVLVGARVVATLGAGAWLGEMAMLTGAVSSTSVVAHTDVEAMAVSQDDFLAAAEEDGAIFRHLAHMLAQRLRSTDRILGESEVARIVLLWHQPDQRPFVDAVLAECYHWAPSPLLVLSDAEGIGGPTAVEYMANPGRLAGLERKLAAGPVTLPLGDPADTLLSPFLGLACQFAPLVLVSTSAAISPTTMPRITETVRFTSRRGAPPLASQLVDVPHTSWRIDGNFDPARIARGLCRQRVGLALGGGAARGFAHLGVLKTLRAAGVPVDVVVGTSIGAAIAASVAAGQPPDDIGRAMEVSGRAAMVPQLMPAHSIFTTFFLEQSLRRRFGRLQFSDLELPLGVTAVDLNTAEELVLTSGRLTPAVLASMAIPGIFPPVRHNGRTLVDGGLRMPVPSAACRSLGADIVIASRMRVEVDAGRTFEREALPLMADSFSQALEIMQDQIGIDTAGHADVSIDTAIPRRFAGLFDFRHRAPVEAAGRVAAEGALAQIVELVPGLRRDAPELNRLRAA